MENTLSTLIPPPQLLLSCPLGVLCARTDGVQVRENFPRCCGRCLSLRSMCDHCDYTWWHKVAIYTGAVARTNVTASCPSSNRDAFLTWPRERSGPCFTYSHARLNLFCLWQVAGVYVAPSPTLYENVRIVSLRNQQDAKPQFSRSPRHSKALN